jgi:glycyl-tRNA synthetase (class II)
MVLLDAAILMNPQVWVASGHVGGFSDPLIDDKITGERFRADKLLEDLIENIKNTFIEIRDSSTLSKNTWYDEIFVPFALNHLDNLNNAINPS